MKIQILQRLSLTSPRRRSRCRPGLEGLERRDVPAIITVNSLQDLANPPTGTVTLRSALAQANSTPGGNTINLSVKGDYTIGNGNGPFVITTGGGDLTINNTIGQPVEIDGGGASRVFDINSADSTTLINVAFQGITIQNGSATGSGVSGSGGGIRSDGPVNLSLTNVTLLNNKAAVEGGGVSIDAPSGQAWSLTVNASTFITNHSNGGGGGGVFAGNGVSTSGTVAITNSEFSGNIATGTGNGATAGYGGGLDVGAISTAFLVSNSTFNGNSATQDGGAIDYSGTGTVSGSPNVFSALTNCTIVGNSAGLVGGGVCIEESGDLEFVNDTINGNSAINGGGTFVNGSNLLTFLNSIVALNTASGGAIGGPDVYDTSFFGVIDDGGNFIGTINQGHTGFNTATTLTGNPLLSILQDNGGPSIGSLANPQDLGTEAPFLSSPVINKGNVVSGTPSTPTTDERGLPRSTAAGGHVTIGAFEPQGTTVTPSQEFVVESNGQVYAFVNGSYVLTASGQVLAMQALRLGNTGNYIVFVVGTDNQVYAEKVSSNGTSGGYYHTAFGSVLSMTAGTDASGNPLLFVISTSSDKFQLYEQKFNLNGDPTSGGSYVKAAFGNFKTAIVTHDANGNPLLYATGQDNLVYGLQMNVSGTPIGGLFRMGTGTVNQLAVGHDASNNPEVFVVGTDAGLGKPGYVYYLKAKPNGSPAVGQGVYNSGTGGPVRALSLASDASNNPELFVIGNDSPAQPYAHKFNATGDQVGSFFTLAGGVADGVSALAAGYDANQNPLLYVVDATSGQVYSLSFNASGSVNGKFTQNGTATNKVTSIVLA